MDKKELEMSWYNRKPRKNEPHKIHINPQHSSPMAQKMMEEAKSIGPKKSKNKNRML